MSSAATWITRLDLGRAGPRVAVKDLVDVAGTPTTAGCRAVADLAGPAGADAACMAGLRRAVEAGGARLVGKTNLHELADGITGINPWFGTPVNPLDRSLVPGGSSSGSATAVADGDADIAVGTDTAGSIRIPAACCGVTGLSTTAGRIPTAGVWPLSPTLDRIGPLATDVAGIAEGMRLLDRTFDLAAATAGWDPTAAVGRVRPDLPLDPAVDAAVDAALAALGVPVTDVVLPGWLDAAAAGLDIIAVESVAAHGALVAASPDRIGADVARHFAHAATVGRQRERVARAAAARWAGVVARALDGVAVLALPTAGTWAPPVGDGAARAMTVAWTLPVNVAGLPALAVPIRSAGRLPASLQLVGPRGGEELLCRVGRAVESAAGHR